VKQQYILIEDTMRPRVKQAARRLNGWGGVGPALLYMALGVVLGIVPLAVSLTTRNAIGTALMVMGLLVHCLTYWFIGRPMFYLPSVKAGSVMRINDRAVIALDKEWMTFIQTLTAGLQAVEHARRETVVRGLMSQKSDLGRAMSIIQFRRELQAGRSPYGIS
jgi:hypothetical protein